MTAARLDEAASRAAVVAEALTWLRTPYAHRQRLKGVGVDCAQFPLAVYTACALIPPTDPGAYAPQWHLHRGEELYLDEVRRLAREIEPQAARPGDLALWRYGRTFSHGALLLDPPRVIHAMRGLGVTLDDWTLNEELRTRPMRVFSLWGEDLVSADQTLPASDLTKGGHDVHMMGWRTPHQKPRFDPVGPSREAS